MSDGIPNIVLFASGRRWHRHLDAFQSNDGWTITALQLREAENGGDLADALSAHCAENEKRDAEMAEEVKTALAFPDYVRVASWSGKTYAIRDVWKLPDGTFAHEYPAGVLGVGLERCEYAVKRGSDFEWKPCEEGCEFSEIEAVQ